MEGWEFSPKTQVGLSVLSPGSVFNLTNSPCPSETANPEQRIQCQALLPLSDQRPVCRCSLQINGSRVTGDAAVAFGNVKL